ncbi:MAG: branched-chain amino acid transport system substrate-binding protein [Actinomycetota bacterium]|nr:branched-chain amino acid transport system substrate-binding protein [Actinomycetota bacterium]MDQ1475344.1 branched-chain amino acid transport system substrate-binding protein [Actinomycetota bacterium]
MRGRRNGTLLAVLGLLSSVMVACSSSSGGGAGTTATGASGGSTPTSVAGPEYAQPSGSVRGFDGTTIRVASLGIKSQLPTVDIGASARIKRFNDTNEIPGVKLDYIEFADDNQDRATALSEARRLVAQEKVFGIVGDVSSVNPLAYFKQQHVPYFGFAFDDTYCTAKPDPTVWGFGIDGCLVPNAPKQLADSAGNIIKYARQATGKDHPTVALFSSDTPSGQNAAKFDEPPYAGAGFDVVFAKGIVPPPPVSDYTPYVQQLLHSNKGGAPDAIVCLLTTDCIPMYGLLQANKYPGLFISALYSDLVLTSMKGSAVFTVFAPLSDPTAANARLKADIKAVKASQAPDLGSAVGYFAADMFIQAVKNLVQAKGKSYISPENVQQAAAHMTWEIKGQIGPVKYPASTVIPTPACTAVVVDADGAHWKTVVPYSCSYKTFAVSG